MPPDLNLLRKIFHEKCYLFSAHASDRAAERGIFSKEIEEAVINGEVIEDYRNDKYGPSCLILGKTDIGRILHIQVSYPPKVKIVTLYEPSTDEWEADFKVRKPKT